MVSARMQVLPVKAPLLAKHRMLATEALRLGDLGRQRLLTPMWAMAEQVQVPSQEVRILPQAETLLPLQLIPRILQLRQEGIAVRVAKCQGRPSVFLERRRLARIGHVGRPQAFFEP